MFSCSAEVSCALQEEWNWMGETCNKCTFIKNLELNSGFFPAVSKYFMKQVADMYAITEDNLLALSFTLIV